MTKWYVGSIVFESSSTLAFSNPSVTLAYSATARWCVVIAAAIPRSAKRVRTARASAEPSSGSVPVPSSSSSTSERGPASFRTRTTLPKWDENVDTDRSMLCASPMSANTLSKTDRDDPEAAGICNPAWCISTSNPIVFRATVLPPVFGPVITSARKSGPIDTVIGTTSSPSRGCRADTSRRPAGPAGSVMATRSASIERASRARAAMRSSAAAASSDPLNASLCPPTTWDSLRRTLSSSRIASAPVSRHSLHRSTASKGSTNRVAPVCETSCTMPGTAFRCSTLTSSTRRSPRVATADDCSAARVPGRVIERSSLRTSRLYVVATRFRSGPRRWVALSSTSPLSEIAWNMRSRSHLRSAISSASAVSRGI